MTFKLEGIGTIGCVALTLLLSTNVNAEIAKALTFQNVEKRIQFIEENDYLLDDLSPEVTNEISYISSLSTDARKELFDETNNSLKWEVVKWLAEIAPPAYLTTNPDEREFDVETNMLRN